MGRNCAAVDCTSSDATKKNKPNVTFHRFPKDNELRQKWEDVLNKNAWKATKFPVLCSLHFDPSCFMKTISGRMQLMPGSVPSIFPSMSSSSSQNTGSSFAFVAIKSENGVEEENTIRNEEMRMIENVKVECDEELYPEPNDANFIDVRCDTDAIIPNDAEPENDPLEDQVSIKQEIPDTESEGCLTDYVIPEDQAKAEVKEEDEVIIDDGESPMDWEEEEEDNSSVTTKTTRVKQKKFKCKSCVKYFGYIESLQEHELTHVNDELFSCHICFQKFTKTLLKKHMEEEHKNALFTIGELTCEICFKKFKTINSLKNHTLFHKVERQLRCSKCQQMLDWVGSLQQYNRFKTGEKPFVCRACDQITMAKLIEIASTKKTKAISSATNSLANAVTVTNNTVAQIIQGQTVSCGVCNKRFISKSFLMVHELEHKVEKDMLCSSCGSMIGWSGTLGQCNRFISGEEEFMCVTCVAEKGVECSVCKEKVSLGNGIYKADSPETEKQFVCSTCNITNVASTLPVTTTQLLAILPKPPPRVKIMKPNENICSVCNVSFKTFHKLHSHKQIHKVQSQIECSNCKKVIKWFGSLASLEDFISGKKRIVCTECVTSNPPVNNVQSQVQYVHANVTCSYCLEKIKWVGSMAQLDRYTSHLEKILCERCSNTVRTINRDIVPDEGHNVQVNVICSSCQRMFQWSGTFTQLASVMADKNPTCPVCEKKPTASNAKSIKWGPEADLSCKICKRKFHKVSKKFQVCSNKNIIEVNCKCCSNLYEFVCEDCSHIYPQKDTSLICDICRPSGKLSFTDLTSFLTHIKCHVPIKDFVCTICNQVGYWGGDSDSVEDFKCKRCNNDSSVVEFSNLTKENIIFENKIVDHFSTTPLIEKDLECRECNKMYPWCGSEKQFKEFTNGVKVFICLKCI